MPKIYRDVDERREYYLGYNGKFPEVTRVRGFGADLEQDQAETVVRQLATLGYPDFKIESAREPGGPAPGSVEV